MKTILMRTACLILVLLMLAPAVVACKKDGEGEGSESVSTPDVNEDNGGESESSKYDVKDDLGDIDLDGRTVIIAQSGIDDYANEIHVERLTGDVVSDAIYKRNANVEKRLNIKIQHAPVGKGVYSVLDNLETGMLDGSVKYDLILNPSYANCARITKGYYHNLKAIDNLDLDKVYWSEYLNETLEIGGVQYMASGAVSLSFYKFIFVTAVNNRMLAENKNGAPDLVGAVKSGKWTLEYQKQVTSEYYTDKGAHGKDDEDIVGLVTSTSIPLDPYMSSGEVTVLTKGEDGYYSWNFDKTRASAVLSDIVELINAKSTCVSSVDTPAAIADKFADGTALMATVRLFELESASIRDMKDTYTILPIPRWSEDQTGYYSLISDRFTSMAIPTTVTADDIENVGAVMEALASESYRQVTPAYYEIVLKTRYAEDADGYEMMDMITQNVKMDAVLPYTAALEFSG